MKAYLIILIIILLGIIANIVLASSSLPPLFVEDAVNSQINQLWSKSPTGTYAFHEAPSINYSFWIDDNAKFLESIAPWWQSYSTYVSDILQFIQQGDIGGLFIIAPYTHRIGQWIPYYVIEAIGVPR